MGKAVLVVFLALLAQGLVGTEASAQTPAECFTYVSCSQYSLWDATCLPTLPLIAFNCVTAMFDFDNATCEIPSKDPKCAPPPPCNCGTGHPISLADGNTWIVETDLTNPGLGGGLTLRRRWNSIWPSSESALQIGMFGPNWRSTYEESISLGFDHYLKYGRSDGSFWSFTYDPGTSLYVVVAPANGNTTLAAGSSYWTLTFQNGEKRLFDNVSGKLIAIIDRNGNTTQMSYDSFNRLTTVTDAALRHLYFSYGAGSSLVSSVTTDFGVSLSYAYDTSGRLTQVTEPDSSTISFQYNSQSLITSVLDTSGKILETHTYDTAGRGLTSSQANGANAVTLSYTN